MVCGIAGLIDTSGIGPEPVGRMVGAMAHRGPDGSDVVTIDNGGPRVHLGHCRLKVIDTSNAGHQPMHDPENGNWIAFNGEVYNHGPLRAALEAEGERFTSRSDTEVVLKALGRRGPAAIHDFRGMFAFAYWDATARRLHLVRDRLGLKPLYIARTSTGDLAFASEVRALLASGLVDRRLDPDGVAVYLWNGFTVAPRTLVDGVRSMLPATRLELDHLGQTIGDETYWSPPAPAADGAGEVSVEALRATFDEAVALRRQADVPLGAFLSGGLDSSAIVATLARDDADLHAFSIGFAEAEFDESDHARALSREAGNRHTVIDVTERMFLDDAGDALAAFDQPSFDGVNSWFVSRVARESGLTVALSGLGADELFGGYPMFRQLPRLMRAAKVASLLPRTIRQRLRFDSPNDHARRAKLTEFFAGGPINLLDAYQVVNGLLRRDFIDSVIDDAPRPDAFHGLPRERASFADVAAGADPESISRVCLQLFLGERCLRDADQTSMASSLEVRAPFTDHVFLEQVLRVPAKIRAAGPPQKPFECALFADRVPPSIRERKKQGFTMPLGRWLRHGMLDTVRDTLLDTQRVRDVGLAPEPIARLFADFERGYAGAPWSRVWALTVLVDWCTRHGVTRSA